MNGCGHGLAGSKMVFEEAHAGGEVPLEKIREIKLLNANPFGVVHV